MPLDEMIDDYLERTRIGTRSPVGLFLTAMKEQVSIEGYRQIQERHLSAETLKHLLTFGDGSALEKYLNFPVWAASKFKWARTLEMDTGKHNRVLDLGAGPGHFGLVARYLGIEYVGLDYVGTDLPFVHEMPAGAFIYDDFFRLFGLDRVDQAITAGKPLDVPGRFDLITCFMGIFPVSYIGTEAVPWDAGNWRFFLHDLTKNIVTPERFTMLFQIAPVYISPVVDYLRPLCRKIDVDRGTFTIDETINLATG